MVGLVAGSCWKRARSNRGLLLILFAYGDGASGLILLELDYGEDLVSLKLIHAVQER